MQRKLLGLLIVLAASLLANLMGSKAFAQSSAPLTEDDPAVWAARAARATSLRAESTQLRHAADDKLAQESSACRKKFFENACKDSARSRWIEQINKVRALEIEAVGLERNQRAHETELRAKERAANPPKPMLELPKPVASAPVETPKPQAKPINPLETAEKEVQRLQGRAEREQEAAARAAQTKKDADRYAERAKAHAKKLEEAKAKKSGATP